MIHYFNLNDQSTRLTLSELFPPQMEEMWNCKNGYSIMSVGSGVQMIMKAGPHLLACPMNKDRCKEMIRNLEAALKVAAENGGGDEQC